MGDSAEDPAALPLPDPLHGYFDHYGKHPYLAAALEKTLGDGSSIVLMGSSELTTADHPAKPMNFFNKELNQPLFAIGHDGNQCFSMHAQLIAANADLSHSRLAILLSPSWFTGKSGKRGTELSAFLEYQPSPSLYRIRRMAEGGDTNALLIGQYLHAHGQDLSSAQPITQWLMRDASAVGPWLNPLKHRWDAWIIAATEEEMLRTPARKPWTVPEPKELGPEDWARRRALSKAEHLAHCTNNSVFVDDAFYAEHVQGEFRELEVWPVEENGEYLDFIGLLDYLAARNASPYFVLQPLNPFVYTNLSDLDPTMVAIRGALNSHGFDYLDMWSSDPTEFDPGTLTDVMHLGPLGWYQVDSAMVEHFR
ncbi:MAG: hypothetical protein IPL52_02545 [Flavobacteriales bacterium]|nr:hypothetical protein [Flavobacteriales bacterium]